jgi:hypothetical protein
MNALMLMDGGDREPAGLTGNVEMCWLEFSVGMMVKETAGNAAEDLLDAGVVAISDALLDPTDIQLGGLAVGIQRQGISDPVIGRGAQSGSADHRRPVDRFHRPVHGARRRCVDAGTLDTETDT